jgi:hypothetical protein
LSDAQGSFAKEENLVIGVLEHKVNKIKRDIGPKSKALSVEYNAPTLWETIGDLRSAVDTTGANFKDPLVVITLEVRRAMQPCQEHMLEAVSKKMTALEIYLNKIKSFALNLAKHLQCTLDERLDYVELDLFGETASAPTASIEGASESAEKAKPEWVEEVIKSFKSRIKNQSTRLSKVMAGSEKQAVKFAGLGFLSMREASMWLMIHLSLYHCSLIVDVHTIMEHI